MPNYTQANINSSVANMVSGSYTAAVFLEVANRAVRDVLLEVDLRSSIRKSALTPNLFDNVYQYTCPTDMKSNCIIDVANQINRGVSDDWRLTTIEEFDRLKQSNVYDIPLDIVSNNIVYDNFNMKTGLIAFGEDDMVRKLNISKLVDDDNLVIDSLDSVGTWVAFGDAENLTADTSNVVEGTSCINWDIDASGGTTAGIYNASLTTSVDISEYLTTGSVFAWVYLSDSDDVTNFIVRLGSDSSNYYAITITTTNEGTSFETGWNLLRFDMEDKATTGTPDDDAIDYCAIYMTKDSGKVSETDFRFDNISIKNGVNFNVVYYSKYLWQSNAGVRLENATATTDYIMADADEMNLIEMKIAAYIERYLKNYNQMKDWEERYEKAKLQYQLENPSQKMVMTNTYKDYIQL